MKPKIFILFIVIILVVSCTNDKASVNLHSFTWSLHDSGDSLTVQNANLSDVHLSLLENNIIDEPFYRNNENKIQWIGEKDWEYILKFNADTLPTCFMYKAHFDK